MEDGGLRAAGGFLVLFYIDWNKSQAIIKGSPWRQYFHALGFQLLPFLDFCSRGISVLLSNPGGVVEYDMILITRTVTL